MGRLPWVDALRGIAVLAMVTWHSADGWLVPELKQGEVWSALRTFGGMAAPLFLFLVGVGAALAMQGKESGGRQASVRVGRGLQILVLGYGLRLQGWLLDAGALVRPWTLRAWLPLALGYALLFWLAGGLGRRPESGGVPRHRRLTLLCLAVALVGGGLWQVESVAPGRLNRLLAVDVLQAIGACLVLLSLWLDGFAKAREPRWLCLMAAIVLCLTPWVWSLPAPLPHWLGAYLGRFQVTPGGLGPSRFPLFPWLAYAFAGAALARWANAPSSPAQIQTRLLAFAGWGACVAIVTSEALPPTFRLLAEVPQLAQLVRVSFRLGMIAVLTGLAMVTAHALSGCTRWLNHLGCASLRIYWVHLPFAYGSPGSFLRGRLGFPQWAVALGGLLMAMWLLSRLRIPRDPRRFAHRA